MKILRWLALASVALFVVSEIAFRFTGVLDFPLFQPGPPYGYIPRPNQSGAFMRHNDWVFNERSMGTARPFSPIPAPWPPGREARGRQCLADQRQQLVDGQ